MMIEPGVFLTPLLAALPKEAQEHRTRNRSGVVLD